jgi:phosphoglycolate phosphatase
MKNYNLLVFDWDGTLADSAGLFVELMQKAAADLGYTIPSVAEINKVFGLNLELVQEQFFPTVNYKVFQDIFYKHYSEEHFTSYFFAGAIETLTDLKAKGFDLAIATNQGQAKLEAVLEKTKTKHLFTATRCPDNSFPKPHPEMLLTLLDELSYEPEDALMIGDTVFDMQFAQNAKVDALAACYGHQNKEQLAKFNPVGLLEDIRDLKKVLNYKLQ